MVQPKAFSDPLDPPDWPTGTCVWAKVKGFPPWPAQLATMDTAEEYLIHKHSQDELCVIFFATHDVGWCKKGMIQLLTKGSLQGTLPRGSTKLFQSAIAEAQAVLQEDGSEDGICENCHKGSEEGTILICDGCDTEWHMGCVDPALSTLPRGDWFCKYCDEARPEGFKYKKKCIGPPCPPLASCRSRSNKLSSSSPSTAMTNTATTTTTSSLSLSQNDAKRSKQSSRKRKPQQSKDGDGVERNVKCPPVFGLFSGIYNNAKSRNCAICLQSIAPASLPLRCTFKACGRNFHLYCLRASAISLGGKNHQQAWHCPCHSCTFCGKMEMEQENVKESETFWHCSECCVALCPSHISKALQRKQSQSKKRSAEGSDTTKQTTTSCSSCQSRDPRLHLARVLEAAWNHFLDEMARVLDSTKEIVKNNNGTCCPEDALVIIQSICTVIEASSKFLEREEFRIEAETAELLLLKDMSKGKMKKTTNHYSLSSSSSSKKRNNTNRNGKNCGTSRENGTPTAFPWRRECGEGEGGGGGGENSVSKSLHEWAEFLGHAPLLKRSTKLVLEPQAVEVKGNIDSSHQKRNNLKQKSPPPPLPSSLSPIIIHEPLPTHSEVPSWFELGEAVSVLSAMNGDRASSSFGHHQNGVVSASSTTDDHILPVLESHAKLLREALRQNAQVRCLWLEEKARRHLEKAQERSMEDRDNVVYLGSGDPLYELTVANGQLREQINQLETELGKALRKQQQQPTMVSEGAPC